MSFNTWFFMSIALSLILLLTWWFFPRKKNAPVLLFAAALKNENSGHYEAAVMAYETALDEVKKLKNNKQLKDKITGKIKLLRSIIEYKKSLLFVH